MSAQQFVNAVEREEVGALVKLPGIGKKTAERLIVEKRKTDLKVCMAISLRQPPTWYSHHLPARRPTMLNKKQLPRWWRGP